MENTTQQPLKRNGLVSINRNGKSIGLKWVKLPFVIKFLSCLFLSGRLRPVLLYMDIFIFRNIMPTNPSLSLHIPIE